jgi:hypothetical protein
MDSSREALPLDNDKLYFVCYPSGDVFYETEASFAISDFVAFLGYHHGDYSEDFDARDIVMSNALSDLQRFISFVGSCLLSDNGFVYLYQVPSEINRSKAIFISFCHVRPRSSFFSKLYNRFNEDKIK